MRRLWKALATLAILVILIFLASPRFMPKTLWVVLLVATLTYGITLCLSTRIPAYRRCGIAYLAFTGGTYLLVGIQGLLPNGDLIEGAMWYSLISPYPLLAIMNQCLRHFPCAISKAPYVIMPVENQRAQLFPAAVVVAS